MIVTNHTHTHMDEVLLVRLFCIKRGLATTIIITYVYTVHITDVGGGGGGGFVFALLFHHPPSSTRKKRTRHEHECWLHCQMCFEYETIFFFWGGTNVFVPFSSHIRLDALWSALSNLIWLWLLVPRTSHSFFLRFFSVEVCFPQNAHACNQNLEPFGSVDSDPFFFIIAEIDDFWIRIFVWINHLVSSSFASILLFPSLSLFFFWSSIFHFDLISYFLSFIQLMDFFLLMIACGLCFGIHIQLSRSLSFSLSLSLSFFLSFFSSIIIIILIFFFSLAYFYHHHHHHPFAVCDLLLTFALLHSIQSHFTFPSPVVRLAIVVFNQNLSIDDDPSTLMVDLFEMRNGNFITAN